MAELMPAGIGGEFEKALLKNIDDGLMVLGESVKQAIYFHLEKMSRLKRDMIADNPEAFSSGLETILGAGAEVIEKAVAKRLYSKLGLEYVEKTDYRFADYVKEAKARHQKKA